MPASAGTSPHDVVGGTVVGSSVGVLVASIHSPPATLRGV
jgi:hypothetical protein